MTEYSFSQARSSLTEVIDKVQRLAPVVIRPRKRSEDESIILSRELMHRLLKECEHGLKLVSHFIPEPDSSITLSLEPLGLVATANTREAVIQEMAEELIWYAKEYLDAENIALYSRAPNRKSHLPFVIQIALCDGVDDVVKLAGLA